MTSYNKLNGAYTGCRRDLVTGILRCEGGYKGLVMTDWGTKYDPAAALHAQVDMMMPGADADRDAVLAGLADGSITPRRGPPRRRPRANHDRAELDSKIIKMSISAQQQAKNYWCFS